MGWSPTARVDCWSRKEAEHEHAGKSHRDRRERPEEENDYIAFVRRAAANPIGRRVKMADLRDNCGLSRIADPQPCDYERIEKYRKAIAWLEGLA